MKPVLYEIYPAFKASHSEALRLSLNLQTQLQYKFRNYDDLKVKNVLGSPSLSKVFLLISSGITYNQAIAEQYYKDSKNSRKKLESNPKVIAIYLHRLIEAELIRKGRKRGRFQDYELDYQGILKALVISFDFFFHQNPYFVGLLEMALCRYPSMHITQKIVQKIVNEYDDYFIMNIIESYYIKRRENMIESPNPLIEKEFYTILHDFKLMELLFFFELRMRESKLFDKYSNMKTPLSYFFCAIVEDNEMGKCISLPDSPQNFLYSHLIKLMEDDLYGSRNWSNKKK
jgi:hypothetical protein